MEKKKQDMQPFEYGKNFKAGTEAAAKMYQEAVAPANTKEVVDAIIKQLKVEKDYF